MLEESPVDGITTVTNHFFGLDLIWEHLDHIYESFFI